MKSFTDDLKSIFTNNSKYFRDIISKLGPRTYWSAPVSAKYFFCKTSDPWGRTNFDPEALIFKKIGKSSRQCFILDI